MGDRIRQSAAFSNCFFLFGMRPMVFPEGIFPSGFHMITPESSSLGFSVIYASQNSIPGINIPIKKTLVFTSFHYVFAKTNRLNSSVLSYSVETAAFHFFIRREKCETYAYWRQLHYSARQFRHHRATKLRPHGTTMRNGFMTKDSCTCS